MIRKGIVELNCQECKTLYTAKRYRVGESKFCSHGCYSKNKKGKRLVTKICEFCKLEYKVKPFEARIQRYCSKNCFNKSKPVSIICRICNKVFPYHKGKAKQRLYCSMKCRIAETRIYKGVNGGGFTKNDWLQKLKYYGYRCYLCGVELASVVVHKEHRIPVSRGGTNWIANIAPACKSCNQHKSVRTEKEYREIIKKQKALN